MESLSEKARESSLSPASQSLGRSVSLPSFPLVPFLLALWGIGVLFFATRIAVGVWCVRRAVREARQIDDDWWLDTAARLSLDLGIARPVKLLSAASAEVALSVGQTVGEVCRSLGISEQSYYRWRSEYGGMKLEQVKRLKELEKENVRLKRAVAELTLDKLILKEAAEGNY